MISVTSSSFSTSSIVDSNESIQHFLYDCQMIKAISHTLLLLIKENKGIKSKHKSIEKLFRSKRIPEISVYDYLMRIFKYTEINISTLIISLIYIDRFCEINDIILTHYNIHKIIFTSALLSLKYNEDYSFKFNFYDDVAGMSIKEIKHLEYCFFSHINSLFIEQKDYETYEKYLKQKSINN